MLRTRPPTEAEKTAVLLKYGSMRSAFVYWWGRMAYQDDEWELNVVLFWQDKEMKRVDNERKGRQETTKAD